MQILICSHDGVQDQVVDPVQFQTTWAIYRILRSTSCRFQGLDFFLSTRQIQLASHVTENQLIQLKNVFHSLWNHPLPKTTPLSNTLVHWVTVSRFKECFTYTKPLRLQLYFLETNRRIESEACYKGTDVVLMPWCPPLLQDSQKNKANCKAQTLETKESGLSFYLLNEILNIEIPSA